MSIDLVGESFQTGGAMPAANRLRDLVSETVRAVVRADSLDEAVGLLAGHFQDEYSLWRVSVGLVVPGRRWRVAAVWSVGEPAIEKGMEIPFTLTPATERVAATLIAGNPVLLDPSSAELGMIADVFRSEGMRSMLIVPLRDDGAFRAVLSLASTRADAFEPADKLLFGALAVGIERHVMSLVAAEDPQWSAGD